MKQEHLNGLVLTGGQSSRMGQDKALIRYHAMPQMEHSFRLLLPFCENVFLSVARKRDTGLPQITDLPAYSGIGPAAGLLSAYEYRNGPWLVLGTDYPDLQSADIAKLLQERDPSLPATAYVNEAGFYEPMICVYESGFYPLLKNALNSPPVSLQKLLGTCGAKAVRAEYESRIKSYDTPPERKNFKRS